MRQLVISNLYDKLNGYYNQIGRYFFPEITEASDKKNDEPRELTRDVEFSDPVNVRMLTRPQQFSPTISYTEALKLFFATDYPEAWKLFFTSIIADGSVLLYIVTTANAPEYAKVGGPASNFITNFFVVKVFTDYALQLIKEKKYLQATVAIATATVLYIPYMLIAILESPYGESFTAFIGIVTLLSGGGLYGYGVIDVASLAIKLKNAITRPAILRTDIDEEKVRATVLRNIAISKERGRFVSYQEKELSEMTVSQDYDQYEIVLTQEEKEKMHNTALLKIGLDFATELDVSRLSFKNPDQKWTSFNNIIHVLCQVMASLILVYGSYAYMCVTEQAARDDFKFSSGLAFSFSNVILVLQYILSIKGGFELVSGISNNLMPTINNRQLPNNLKMGGTLGHAVKILSLGVAAGFSIPSGYTSKKLYSQSCPSSMLNLMFTGAGTGIYVSSSAFNGIYNLMAFNWLIMYCTEQAAKRANASELQKSVVYESDDDQEPLQLSRTRRLGNFVGTVGSNVLNTTAKLPPVKSVTTKVAKLKQKQMYIAQKDAAYVALQDAHDKIATALKAAPLRDACTYQIKTSSLNQAEMKACQKGGLIVFRKRVVNENKAVWYVHFSDENNQYRKRKVVDQTDIAFLNVQAVLVTQALDTINNNDSLIGIANKLNSAAIESGLTADIMLFAPDKNQIPENAVIFSRASNTKWAMYSRNKKQQEVVDTNDIAILNNLESKMLNVISSENYNIFKNIAKSLGSNTPYTLRETLESLGMIGLELQKKDLFELAGLGSDTRSERSMRTNADIFIPTPAGGADASSRLLSNSGQQSLNRDGATLSDHAASMRKL